MNVLASDVIRTLNDAFKIIAMQYFSTVSFFGWIPAGGGDAFATLLVCFLIGGIPFGYFAGRMNGIDIRKEGSGNIGSTNVVRVLGRVWGYSVFALDFFKALLPVLFLKYALERQWVSTSPFSNEWFLILSGVMVVMGHNYCPYLGFKGGKGMASSAGFLMALLPPVFVVCFLTWVFFFYTTRYVSIASIAGSISVPVAAFIFYPGQTAYHGLAMILALLGIWRHRSNISRLVKGTELKFGSKQP